MAEEEKITAQAPCEGGCEACGGCAAEQTAPEETVSVVDICFRENGKAYYFDPGSLTLHSGDHVIIDTARGQEYGVCASGVHTLPKRCAVLPLRRVLRIATEHDEMIRRTNLEKEREALRICQQKIEEHKLDMLLVAAEYAFDGGKILFFFTSEGRVDFRELVKDLASTLHTRIELRQIGVRDKAKMVGGLGICGRPFCCKQFLDDFEPVSIKMAKTQNLSLNPTKISGTCGRLMCCLKYEQEAYEDLIKTVPKADSFVDTPDGRGTVTDVNLLRQTVRVRMERSPDEFGTYPIGEIYVIRNGKAKKGDPPIPEDFAPISSAPRRPRMVQEEAMPDVVLIRDQTEEAAQPESEEAAPQRRRRRRGKHAGGEQPEAAPAAEKPAEAAAPEQKKSRYRRRPRRRGGKNNPPV